MEIFGCTAGADSTCPAAAPSTRSAVEAPPRRACGGDTSGEPSRERCATATLPGAWATAALAPTSAADCCLRAALAALTCCSCCSMLRSSAALDSASLRSAVSSSSLQPSAPRRSCMASSTSCSAAARRCLDTVLSIALASASTALAASARSSASRASASARRRRTVPAAPVAQTAALRRRPHRLPHVRRPPPKLRRRRRRRRPPPPPRPAVPVPRPAGPPPPLRSPAPPPCVPRAPPWSPSPGVSPDCLHACLLLPPAPPRLVPLRAPRPLPAPSSRCEDPSVAPE